MEIRVDDLSGRSISAFLEEHLEDMRSVSPPETKHALDLESLKAPDIVIPHDRMQASFQCLSETIASCGGYSLEHKGKTPPHKDPAEFEHFVDGLRKAGIDGIEPM